MGVWQQAIAEAEHKQHIAAVIGSRTHVLKGCKYELCGESTWDREESEGRLEEAYKYAAWLLKNNDPLTKDFKTQRELTDFIKNLENEFGTECACERLLAKN
jgi:hypothetical protein